MSAMEVDGDVGNLPWVEKYRPESLDDVVSHKSIIQTLQKFISANQLPHLLFYGPPGTGKTTSILAAARSMYSSKQRSSMMLELNASDDRGINVVREDIITFAQTKALNVDHQDVTKAIKLVILDEADSMTKDAQNALRRVIEKYTSNVRFCIICNYLSSIIPAIQSRCTRFRFAPLELSLIKPRLDHVIEAEKLDVTDCGRKALLELSGGDMRRVLNVLQAVSMAFPVVNEQTVYQCVGQPTPKEMESLLKILLNDTFQNCCKKLETDCYAKGFALADVISRLHDIVLEMEVPSKVTIGLASSLADIEHRLAAGGSDRIQGASLVAAFVIARRQIAESAA